MCAFPGCPNPKSPKAAKCLCNSHYWQMHKGRDLTPLSYRRNQCMPWIEEHSTYEGDECLKWPYQRSDKGYAAVKRNGKQRAACPVMCEIAHGPKPTPDHEAAHSCGKGHEGCINPKHLRWATHTENLADQLIHGTRIRGEMAYNAKLTEDDVRYIRAMRGKISQSKLAASLGVKQVAVYKVQHRITWAHVDG